MHFKIGTKGYYVRWHHSEFKSKVTKSGEPETPRIGRSTTCEILEGCGKEAVVVATGYAHTHPKDMFNKGVGRKVSLTRALKSAFDSKNHRREAWVAYFGLKKDSKIKVEKN